MILLSIKSVAANFHRHALLQLFFIARLTKERVESKFSNNTLLSSSFLKLKMSQIAKAMSSLLNKANSLENLQIGVSKNEKKNDDLKYARMFYSIYNEIY